MRVLPSNVIVRVDSEYKKKMKYKSLELEVSQSFAPYNHNRHTLAQTSGEVICAPERLVGGGEVKIQVGDKAYWHFNSISNRTRLDWMNDKVHQILYDHLFCKVTDAGEVVMLNGRVLLEPIYDQGTDEQGFVTSSSGLITSVKEPKYNTRKAILRHIGDPAKGQPDLELEAGDIVWYEKDSDFINEIEGKEYFVCYQQDLMVKEL